MPITECSECRKEVSTEAKTCPNCGYSFFKKDPTLVEDSVICAIIGAGLGFFIAQYFPLFGELAKLGVPYCQARYSQAPSHMVLFALISALIIYIIKKNGIRKGL